VFENIVFAVYRMIQIENLVKSFGPTTIVNGISFSVQPGEILGFLGPNGAGKTTTMKMLTGFWSPTSGRISVGDLEMPRDSLRIRSRLGYLPETVPLYDELRVYEYLRFIAAVRGVPASEQAARLREAADACGLNPVLAKPIEELSKGFRQRVGLAQAILHHPDILILDEPTTGLDPNQIVEIRNLIKQLGKNKTVIFSTHILSEVSATCNRVIIINKGVIVGQGTPAELMQKAGGQEIIYVKIKGPQGEVIKKLKEIREIKETREKDKESEDIIGYELEPEAGVDVREKLSNMVMQQNWSILEFSRKTASLEDVFRELTK
jgi:ABC-2 type transport system ATP-binding protein